MIRLAILIGLLIGPSAQAWDLTGSFGTGLSGKIIQFSTTEPLWKDFLLIRGTLGMLASNNIMSTDWNPAPEASVGFQLRNKGGFYFRAFQGMSWLIRTTGNLNTHWQFPTEAGFGLYNDKFSGGIFWKHYSNGTTSRFNRGQEYLGLDIGITF